MNLFSKGDSRGVTITVRRFMIPEDVQLVYQWGAHHFGGRAWRDHPPIAEISNVFQSIHDSEIAQAFIVEANGQVPLFEIDVRLAAADHAGAIYDVKDGDHLVCLIFSPNTDDPLLDQGLNTCVEYFFTKAPGNFNRLVVLSIREDRHMHNLLVRAGFEPLKVKSNGKTRKVYALTKAAFMHRQLMGMN